MKINRKILIWILFTTVFLSFNGRAMPLPVNIRQQNKAIIANHEIINMVRLDLVPDSAIVQAKNELHIAYGHTSHGSQIITGMNALPAFKELNDGVEGLYDWNEGGTDGALDIDDYFVSGDLGNPDRITWANRTREYLNNQENSDVNVVMWSWCGQVSSSTEDDINTYLTVMTELETEYPDIIFVYMTGHTDGSGLEGNLHIRNNQIREYCMENNKVLYDFEDIESYDPDGNYFGDKNVNDNCDYTGGNWALEWQSNHTEGVDWYDCSPAHTQALNGNLKAYAAWWLWARLAGWGDNATTTESSSTIVTSQNTTTPSNSSGSSNATWGFNLIVVTTAFIFALLSRRRGKK